MRLTFWGTDSGTEPVADRRHVCVTLELNGMIYWFDAGEGCSHTAYTHGMDLSRVRRIFISHSHMDHIGGLGNLLWNIRKLDNVFGSRHALPLDIYVPESEPLEALMTMLSYTEGGFKCDFSISEHIMTDGVICDDGNIKVTALHNTHMADRPDGAHRAFGFLIEAEGKRVIYTGDTGGVDDYAPLFPCDMLITETGHHRAFKVCEALSDRGLIPSEAVVFTHHGVEILADFAGELRLAQDALPGKVRFMNDTDSITL